MGIAADRYDWFVAHVRAGSFDEATAAEGFAPSFLAAVPAKELVELMTQHVAAHLVDELARDERGAAMHVSYGGVEAMVNVEVDPPHRFEGLIFRDADHSVKDPRVEDAPWTTDAPAAVVAIAREQFVAEGLVGMTAAVFDDHGAAPIWHMAGGWADLEADRHIRVGDRMLAGSISKLFTATAVLHFVATGAIDLDVPANRYLTRPRIASDAVTIRHLLTHHGGTSNAFEHFVAHVPPPAELLGDTVEVTFEPGSRYEYSNAGYTLLGEAIAAVSGQPIADALTSIVLEPLHMTASSFALAWPDDVGPGYTARDNVFSELQRIVPSVPAAGGLVTTVDDLAKFVAGWRSLLPDELAQAAITPQAARDTGGAIGFGWILGADLVGHAGGTMSYTSSLLWDPSTGRCGFLITNRHAPAESINATLLQATA